MLEVRRALVLGLLAVGVLSLGQAGWIHAKAITAQWLLESAWDRARAGAPAPRPWPWADTSPVAELAVPATGTRLLVLAGASGRNLAFGPTLVADSAPLGSVGNTVLTGHRDTHFGFLQRLKPGDRVELTPPRGDHLVYRVVSTEVVHIDDLALDRGAERPELTLVTCFPFEAVRAGGPLRYVVRAIDGERS